MIKITCLSENTVFRYSLLASHGQSLHINYFGTEYLFDTGEVYEGFAYNSKRLGISLQNIKNIIMSHSHLDHFAALPKLINQLTSQKLYLPPDISFIFTNEKKGYSNDYRIIDGKELSEEEVIALVTSKDHEIVTKEKELENDLYTTGPLPAGELVEQSLVINIKDKGLVILVACSHSTVPAIIQKARNITGVEKIYGIIGGLHYKDMEESQINTQVNYLRNLSPEFIVPSHCTGYNAIRVMQNVLGDVVKVSGSGQFGTGNSITILPELSFDLK